MPGSVGRAAYVATQVAAATSGMVSITSAIATAASLRSRSDRDWRLVRMALRRTSFASSASMLPCRGYG